MANEKGKGASATEVTVTPPFIASWPSLFEVDGLSKEYEITMIFDEDKVDLGPMKKALANASTELWGSRVPKRLKNPWKSGDAIAEEKGIEMYEGKSVVKAKSKDMPAVYDYDGSTIVDPKDLYAGCLCRAVVVGFAYSNKFGSGVRYNLVSVQKLRDGQRFGSSKPKIDAKQVLADAGDADLSDFDDFDGADPDEF